MKINFVYKNRRGKIDLHPSEEGWSGKGQIEAAEGRFGSELELDFRLENRKPVVKVYYWYLLGLDEAEEAGVGRVLRPAVSPTAEEVETLLWPALREAKILA